MNQRKIPLQVKSDRVIELFARDIYQSPLSFYGRTCKTHSTQS